MTDRDRLIQLLEDTLQEWECDVTDKTLQEIAEHLIENGVIVPPCKVGDTIYFETYRRGESIGVQPHKVAKINVVVTIERPFGGVGAEVPDWQFGKYVFLTREEAEKALKDRRKEDEGK